MKAAIFAKNSQSAVPNPTQSMQGEICPVRPRGVPESWVQQAGRKPGNTKWVNPENPHDYVRLKPDGTITQVRNGVTYDIDGNIVSLKSPEAHGIKPNQFIFREK